MTPLDRIAKGMWWDRAWTLTKGCSPESPGCDNCWSAAQSHIRSKQRNPPECYVGVTDEHGRWNWRVEAIVDNLAKPLSVRKPQNWTIWNDLFHPAMPFEFIAAAFGVMAATPHHTYFVLTKRIERAMEWFGRLGKMSDGAMLGAYNSILMRAADKIEPLLWERALERTGLDRELPECEPWPLPNVILMTSVEDQATADERIPLLLRTPAALRGISLEPMLGPVDLKNYIGQLYYHTGERGRPRHAPSLDWVICGGESGPKARPMHPDWARSVRDQCGVVGVPFFFKQWGGWRLFTPGDDEELPPGLSARVFTRVGKAAGRELDGKFWNQMPEVHRG